MNQLQRDQRPYEAKFPIFIYDKRPFLEGVLNGEKRMFLLDSGCQDILLNTRYIDPDKAVGNGQATGLTGTAKLVYTPLGKLSFGNGWDFESDEVCAVDMTHLEEEDFGIEVHGMIGFRQLVHYDWLIDYKKKELYLWSRFPKNDFEIIAKMRCSYQNHLPIIDVLIAGQTFQLLVDTGCDFIVIDEKKKHLIESEVVFSGVEQIASASADKADMDAGKIDSFQVAGLDFSTSDIKFTNIERIVGAYGGCDGIIGYDLLRQYPIVQSWSVKAFYFLKEI